MATPLVLVIGAAGSGKDTVAAMIAKRNNGIVIAHADPMKRFVQATFGFTYDQLWGPSDSRNGLDTRFAGKEFSEAALTNVANFGASWLRHIDNGKFSVTAAIEALKTWARELLEQAVIDGGLTPRKVLQTLGTEFGRQLSQQVWCDYASSTAMYLLGGGFTYTQEQGLIAKPGQSYDIVVISDGRFRNEIVGVKRSGGKVFKIDAPDTDGTGAEAAGVKGHRSEAEQREIPGFWFDARIINDKTLGLEALEEVVDEVMSLRFGEAFVFESVRALP